jgi:dTDP-4-dehydrorhamnose 3,5-epimerase
LPSKLIKPKRFGDDRGWFSETYNRRDWLRMGVEDEFVQDNHSMSARAGVLRGLHFQAPPHAQAKLVRCVRGRIWDVVVDIRRGSPTYGKWAGAELTPDNGLQLYAPVGFAHGFITLEPESEVHYKASHYYAPASEGGLIWDDEDLALPWPAPEEGPILSDKDRILPRLKDFVSPFDYDGTPLSPLEPVSP